MININSILKNSIVNGPGYRVVLWLQGCSIGCRDCFNPDTQPFEPKRQYDIDAIFKEIINIENIEGITYSGGEPFEQAEELYELVKKISLNTKLTQIVYSGYYYKKIKSDIVMSKILEYIDVLIDGPYIKEQRSIGGIKGSNNQNYYFFTDRYSLNDFDKHNEVEYQIFEDGSIKVTGFPEELK